MLEFRIDLDLVCGGQPSRDDLDRFCSEGIRTVVDLRQPDEAGHPLDERAQVESLGMRYVALPVDGETQLTVERACELTAVLRGVEKPVLVHCGTANRVGALLALGARHEEGRSVEASVAYGKSAGLAGAEGKVRALL